MRKRFTLYELIVVIAVVSILISLIAPALGKAKNKVQSSVCISNLQSIGRGVSMYTNDYDGYSMPASFGDTTLGGMNHFINYMISVDGYSERTFRCPSMPESEMFDPAGHDPVTGNIYTKASYIMNIIKSGSWNGSGLPGNGVLNGWCKDAVTPIKVSTVKEPWSKVLILDIAGGVSGNHSGVNSFLRTDHGPPVKPPLGLSRWIGNHHYDKFNAVFGDGHVETLEKSVPASWAVNF